MAANIAIPNIGQYRGPASEIVQTPNQTKYILHKILTKDMYYEPPYKGGEICINIYIYIYIGIVPRY